MRALAVKIGSCSSVKDQRDPRQDPQVDDAICKVSPSTGKRRVRVVVKRVNDDITYRDQTGREHVCWISTWREWARTAEVAVAS